jgi:hypothetical protein
MLVHIGLQSVCIYLHTYGCYMNKLRFVRIYNNTFSCTHIVRNYIPQKQWQEVKALELKEHFLQCI